MVGSSLGGMMILRSMLEEKLDSWVASNLIDSIEPMAMTTIFTILSLIIPIETWIEFSRNKSNFLTWEDIWNLTRLECLVLEKPQALGVQKRTHGILNLSAASRVKDIQPAATIVVTGCIFEDEVSLSLVMRPQSGTRQVFGRDSAREGMSWLTYASEVGSPSGIVSKLKPGKPSKELGWDL
nr:hypothetical protein CFP56_18535 [Quercus suber]